ncbi:MAG: penicillin-binding protein 2 [bacterium]|nr:penicillin-binding protein 2 [bacterium]
MAHLRLHQSFHWRLIFLTLFFLVLLGAVAARIFSLAIVQHRDFVLAARRQHQLVKVLPPLRGGISAQDLAGRLVPLAIQKTFFTLVAVPKDVPDPAASAAALAGILGGDRAPIEAKLRKRDDPYEVIARKLGEGAAERIRTLGMAGLRLEEAQQRVYPQGTLAASVVGFVNSNEENGEEGAYGIERQFQSYLAGERGFFEGEKDAGGSWVALGRRILNPPLDGDGVVLTIDPNIQHRVEEELALALKKWGGESGVAIVLEPKTGRILALASHPTFDPNSYSREKDFSVFRMPAIDSQFELGSVFKPITMAAGIQEGVVTATTTYRDPGSVRVNGFTISNFDGRSHGVQTMTEVLEQSLNTGAMFVGERLGKERFLDAIRRFGFGEKTGIDFPGEVAGDISNLDEKRDVDFATASFGQGIAITPLQIASAIGAIANHGVLMRPYVVEKILTASGGAIEYHAQEVRRVVSPEAAETVSKMLVSVVRKGYDNRAGVPGYFVAAKTGTANIPRKDGRGYSDDVIHTFVGYAPAFDPKFLVLIQMNRPTGNRFAANTLAAPFHNLAEFILNYYQVPPDDRSAL